MNWTTTMAFLLAASMLSIGCTIRTDRRGVTTITIGAAQPAKKKHSRRSASTKHRAKPSAAAKPKRQESAIIKEDWWYQNYLKLQEEHGDYTIPEDAQIEPLPDGRFKVPPEVVWHFQDLLLAKPVIEPTPSP